MSTARPILSLLLLGVAACTATRPQVAAPDPRSVAHVTASAAEQVKRCYRSPRLPREARAARQIVTQLRVRYTPDGQLAEVPSLVSQAGITASNRALAPVMAEAAMVAVVRCSPLVLPAELYHAGWDEFVLTFSPKAFA